MAARAFPRSAEALARLERVAWALFLVCLPVTSFPFFPPAIGGGALVRPLSLYPLLLLLVISGLPRLLKGPVPRTFLSLAPFLIIALASSLLALLRGIEPLLGISAGERLVRAMITLVLGLGFYFTASLMPHTPAGLRSTLRWLYAGLALALAWGSLQAVSVIHFIPRLYALLNSLQRFISTRRLFQARVSGMTYEPNWFAEQITFLYMPWLLGSVLTGQSVFPWRWRRVTVELALLLWSVGVLAFTFSRAGLVNLVVLAFASLVFLRPRRSGTARSPRPAWQSWALRLAQVAGVLALLAGLVFAAGRRNPFFARIWSYWREYEYTSLTGYFEYLGFGARFVYSAGAFNTYTAYPVLGIGLGNYGFYFAEMLPERPLAPMPEVLRIITPEPGRNRLITAKVLYLRLLAETGLIGTAAFAVFLAAVLGCVLFLWLASDPQQKFWGTASLLGFIAFLLAAFSFDSFALPNMWVVFGLITAAAWTFKDEYVA